MIDMKRFLELEQDLEDMRNEKLELRRLLTDAEDEIVRLRERLIKKCK